MINKFIPPPVDLVGDSDVQLSTVRFPGALCTMIEAEESGSLPGGPGVQLAAGVGGAAVE